MATSKQVRFFNELKRQGRPTAYESIEGMSTKEAWLVIQKMLGVEGDGKAYQDSDLNNEIISEYEKAKKTGFENRLPNTTNINPNKLSTEEGIDALKTSINDELKDITVTDIDYYRARKTNSQYLTFTTSDGDTIKIAMGNHYIDDTNGVKKLADGEIATDRKVSGMDTQYDNIQKIGLAKNGLVNKDKLIQEVKRLITDADRDSKEAEAYIKSILTTQEEKNKNERIRELAYSKDVPEELSYSVMNHLKDLTKGMKLIKREGDSYWDKYNKAIPIAEMLYNKLEKEV